MATPYPSPHGAPLDPKAAPCAPNARWGSLACLCALACSAAPPPATPSSCSPPQGVSGAPSSIADALALANDLFTRQPVELTIPCFVESLDRPLGMMAVNSLFSAQPAEGPRSPRVFLFASDTLVMSVVLSGVAVHSLEFAEYVSPTRSMRGEIGFPLQAPVSPRAPFDRIYSDGGTSCKACHLNETRADWVTYAPAFVSTVLQPTPTDEVSLSFLASEASTCDTAVEPERCAMLRGLFGHGPVERRTFSEEAGTASR